MGHVALEAGPQVTTRLRRPGNVATMSGLPDVQGIPARYVALLPNGPMIVLAGTASVIWDETPADFEATLSDRVAARLGEDVDPSEIEDAVQAFVDELVTQGFLERDSTDET